MRTAETRRALTRSWALLIAVSALPLLGAAQGTVIPIPATGKVKFELKSNSQGDVTVKGKENQPAKYKYKITKKDGSTEEHEFEGSEITVKDKEDCTVEVEIAGHRSLPSATWQGTYDAGTYIEFHFASGLGGGAGRSTLHGTVAGNFPGMPDPADPANVEIPRSFNPTLDITGSSVIFLGGKAETGPIHYRLDPSTPVTGRVNLKTGEYTARVALLMDAPNLREVDPNGKEGPLHLVETVSGKYIFTQPAAAPSKPAQTPSKTH